MLATLHGLLLSQTLELFRALSGHLDPASIAVEHIDRAAGATVFKSALGIPVCDPCPLNRSKFGTFGRGERV